MKSAFSHAVQVRKQTGVTLPGMTHLQPAAWPTAQRPPRLQLPGAGERGRQHLARGAGLEVSAAAPPPERGLHGAQGHIWSPRVPLQWQPRLYGLTGRGRVDEERSVLPAGRSRGRAPLPLHQLPVPDPTAPLAAWPRASKGAAA